MTGLANICDRACANVRQPHIDRVLQYGVTPEALATLGTRQLPFGAMTIDVDDAGRWWPDGEGFPAMIVPVIERDELLDVIAFRTVEPARWWWRVGVADMLGYDVLNCIIWPGDRLRVVTTPLDWIAAAGDAVCLLNWSLPDHELSPMRDRAGLDCDTQMLAARLRKRLAQPRRVPRSASRRGLHMSLHELAEAMPLGYCPVPNDFRATPFHWPDPATIPVRRWLFGYWLLRGEITAVVAPGGVGKSTFTAAVALSLASGRRFLDKDLPEGPCTAWLWNLEDDREEMARQITAGAMLHGVRADDCGTRLYVDSGLDQRLCTAIEDQTGFRVIEPVYETLKAEMEARKIDVLIVDPFVSSHEIPENDNSKIDKVAKRWKRLASETKTSIVLVHHTKKMAGREVKAEDSRGAVALINAARSTLVLNPMSSDEAERFGISDRAEQRRIVRVDDDKPNRAPPESAWWFRKASVELGNGDEMHRYGDNVGAATLWTPPDPFEGVSARHLYEVQCAIGAGDWGENVQAKDWAGNAVASALGLSADDDKPRIKSLLRTWIANKALNVERRRTDKGRDKPYIIVGNWVDPASLPALQSGVGNVG